MRDDAILSHLGRVHAAHAALNTFAGNPLDRASDRRADADWLAEQLASPKSLGVALWNGKPLVEAGQGRRRCRSPTCPAKLAGELAGGAERLLFLGLWKDTAVFAVDLEGAADPADGPLQGLGEFEDLRAVALTAARRPTPPSWPPPRQMFEWRRRHRHCADCGQPHARPRTAAGSASARPARPSTSRAPTRW